MAAPLVCFMVEGTIRYADGSEAVFSVTTRTAPTRKQIEAMKKALGFESRPVVSDDTTISHASGRDWWPQ